MIQKVSDDLRTDPAFKSITKPFEVLGVDRPDRQRRASEGARYITQPSCAVEVGREFNRRLKNAFDAEGILTPVKTTPVPGPALGRARARPEGPSPTPPEPLREAEQFLSRA